MLSPGARQMTMYRARQKTRIWSPTHRAEYRAQLDRRGVFYLLFDFPPMTRFETLI
jgi:hypothetical protein